MTALMPSTATTGPQPPLAWARLKDMPGCSGDLQDGTPHPELQLQLGFELRWDDDTGAFDGVWLSPFAANASATMPCSKAVRSSLDRSEKLHDVVIGSGARPSIARRVRYFPSDAALMHLYGCTPSNDGYDCDDARAFSDGPACVDAHGFSSPLLVHSAFLATAGNSTRCVHLIPNMYELVAWETGSDRSASGVVAQRAYEAAGAVPLSRREPTMAYLGRSDTPAMQQRRYLRSRGWAGADDDASEAWLQMPDYMPMEEAAARFAYQLDVGGSSGTTWDALQWKLASGALVFKAKNAEGAADLWHTQLRDGEHLLEVASDFSDLRARYEWARNHTVEAAQIAAAGQRVALANMPRSVHVEALKAVLQTL